MEKTEEQLKREKRNKYINEKLKSYEWYCDICGNGKNYTYRGKYMHLKTKKHNRNLHNNLVNGNNNNNNNNFKKKLVT